MVFSCFIFLGFIAWIVYSVVLSFYAKTRRVGLVSLGVTLVAAGLLLWLADPGTMRAEPPSTEEIIGTWECYRVSPGFLDRAGLDRKDFASKLTFRDASSVTVESMPDEEDTVSFSRSWKLRRPGVTPAGAWTIEIDSGPRLGPYRLVFRKKLGRMTLQKNIDVVYEYEALYRRISDEVELTGVHSAKQEHDSGLKGLQP